MLFHCEGQYYQPLLVFQYMRKWFVLSVLTSRYSGSPESQFDFDIRQVHDLGAEVYIQNVINLPQSIYFESIQLCLAQRSYISILRNHQNLDT